MIACAKRGAITRTWSSGPSPKPSGLAARPTRRGNPEPTRDRDSKVLLDVARKVSALTGVPAEWLIGLRGDTLAPLTALTAD